MFGLRLQSVPWKLIAEYTIRARALLASRKPHQINYGGLVVGWLIGEELPRLRQKLENELNNISFCRDLSIIDLITVRDQIPIDNTVDFPNASWPELLAAYAIGRLGQAHVAFQLKRDRFEGAEPKHSDIDQKFAQAMDRKFLGNLLEATEAVHWAERLAATQDDATELAKKLFTARQRDKALKRHFLTNAVEEEFFHFWATNKFSNKSEAARSFLRMLEKEDRNPFSGEPENTVRTLLRSLRQTLYESSDEDDENRR